MRVDTVALLLCWAGQTRLSVRCKFEQVPKMRTRVQEPGRPSGRPGGRRGEGQERFRCGRPARRGGQEAGMEDAQGTGDA